MNGRVFLSYAAENREVADAVCAGLEACGVGCWLAPRDIRPGEAWAEAIIRGIEGAPAMVVVVSSASNASQQVLREVERAVNKGLTLIPFRIEDVEPSRSFEYFLSVPHWYDATSGALEQNVAALADVVRSVLDPDQPPPDPTQPAPFVRRRRGSRALLAGLGALAALALAVVVWLALTPGTGSDAGAPLQALLADSGSLDGSSRQNVASVARIHELVPNQQIGVKLWLEPERAEYKPGDRVSIKLAASEPGHVAVFAHFSDGSTVLLHPNRFSGSAEVAADQVLTIGGARGQNFALEIGPPFGVDVVHAVVTSDRAELEGLFEGAQSLARSDYRALDRSLLERRVAVVRERGLQVVGTAEASAWGEAFATLRTRPRED